MPSANVLKNLSHSAIPLSKTRIPNRKAKFDPERKDGQQDQSKRWELSHEAILQHSRLQTHGRDEGKNAVCVLLMSEEAINA